MAHTKQHLRPRELFTWDVLCDGGASGVTDDPETALERVRQALTATTPGTRGQVRRVVLSPLGRVAYVDLGLVAEARRDPSSATITWADA